MVTWNRINRRWFLGSAISAADIPDVQADGITHIISAAQELDVVTLGIPPTIHFFNVHWADDGQPKPIKDFRDALDWVMEQDYTALFSGQKLPKYLVVCGAGVNRSALLLTFLMAALSGSHPDVVWNGVVAERPSANGYNVPTYKASLQAALDWV